MYEGSIQKPAFQITGYAMAEKVAVPRESSLQERISEIEGSAHRIFESLCEMEQHIDRLLGGTPKDALSTGGVGPEAPGIPPVSHRLGHLLSKLSAMERNANSLAQRMASSI